MVKRLLRNRSSTENLHYVIRDHPGSSNCSDMFADSSGKFHVKVWLNLSDGGQKVQAQSIHIYGIILQRCCWPGAEQRNYYHACIRVQGEKLFRTKHFNYSFQSPFAGSQKRHGLWDAIPKPWFAFLFSESEIKHSCKSSYVSRMLTTFVNAPSISQLYFCVVRAMHNSNSCA